jgi:uncharacterized protein
MARTDSHGKFIWYELLTADMEAALGFYGKLLGWTSSDSGQSGMDYRYVSMNGEGVGGAMALTADMISGGAKPGWLGYVCVDDVDVSAANIAAGGGTICVPAQDIPNVGRFAMFLDPQGVPLYIMTPLPQSGESLSFDLGRVGHCSWNELSTTDQTAALAFYSTHFGWDWNSEQAMDMGPMGKYQFINHGGRGIGAIMPKMPQMPSPNWTYYFRVADIDAAISIIGALGGQVFHGPTEVPGDDWVINAMDPQGASFALVGAKK